MVKEVRPPTVVKPRSSLDDQQPVESAVSKLPVASSRIPQPSRSALSQRAGNLKSAAPTKLPTRTRAKPASSSTGQNAPKRTAAPRAASPDPLLIASSSRRPPPAAESPVPPPTRHPVRATGGATPTLNRPDDTFVFGRLDQDDTMIGRIAPPSDMAALSSSDLGEDDIPTPRARPKGRAVTGLGRLLTPQASQEIAPHAAPASRRPSRLSRPRPPTPESQELSRSQARAPASPPRRAVPSDTIEEYDTPLREPPESTRQKQARLSATPKANTKRKSLPSAPDTERPKTARKRVATPTPSEVSEHNLMATPVAAPRSRNPPSTEPPGRESVKKRASTPKTQTPNRKRRSSTAERRKTMSGSTPRKLASEVLASRGIRVGIAREALKPTPGDDPLLLMGAPRERRRRLSQTPARSPQKRAVIRAAATEPRLTTTSFGFPARPLPKLPLLIEEAPAENNADNYDYGGGASDDDGEGAANDTFVDVRSRRDLPSRPPSALAEARPAGQQRSRQATPTEADGAAARLRSASESNSPPPPRTTPPSLLHGLQRFIGPEDESADEDERRGTAELEPTYVSPVASPGRTPHPEDHDIHEAEEHEDLALPDGYRSPSFSPAPQGAPSPSMSPAMSFGFDAPTPNVANALDFDSPSLQRILRGSGSVASDAFSPGASPLLPRRISRFAPISSDPPAPPAFTAPVSTAAVAADADRSNSFDAEEDTVIARQSPALSTRARSPAPEVDGEEEEDPPAAVAQETLEEDEEPEEEEEYDNLPVARSPSPGYSPSPGPEDDMDLEGDTVIIADESTEADEILPAETEVDVTVAHPPAREASPAVAVVAEQSLTVPPTATSSRARTEPPASSSPFVSRTGFRFFSPAASSGSLARLSPPPVDTARLSSAPLASSRLSPAPQVAGRQLSPLASAPVLLPPSPAASSRRSVSPVPPTRLSTASASVHEGLDEELDATPSESEKDSSPGPSTAAPAAPVREDRVVPQNDEEPHTDVLGDASAVEEPSLDVDTDADAVAVDEESFEADATAHTAEVGSGAADDHTADAEDDPYEDAEEAEVDQPTSSPRWSASTHRSSIADVVSAALAAGMVVDDQSAPPSSDPPTQEPPATPARPVADAAAVTPTPNRAKEPPTAEPAAHAAASPESQPSEDGGEPTPQPELPLGFRRRMDAGSTPVRPRVSGASQPPASRRTSEIPRAEEPASSSSPVQPPQESTPSPGRSAAARPQKEVTPPPATRLSAQPSPSSPALSTRAASQRAVTATPATVPATAPRSLPASTSRLRLDSVEIPVRRQSLGFPEDADGPGPSAPAVEPSTRRYFIRRTSGAPGVTSQTKPGEGSAITPRDGRDESTSPPSNARHLDSPLSLRSDKHHASPSASLHESRMDTTRLTPSARSPFSTRGSSAVSPHHTPRPGLSPTKAISEQASTRSPAQTIQSYSSPSLLDSRATQLAPAHLIVSSTPEPNTSNTSSNDEAGPTTPSSSSIEVEASSPMAEDTEPSPEPGPISPVRNSVHTFSGTPRATVPEIDKQGFVPSSPMSPTNLSPALSSRLSSGLTLNFGAVAVGSPSRAPRLASPALNSRSSAVADEEREVNEPPVAPGNERSETSLEAPFEEEDTVEVPFEEGDTLEAPFEEGDTLDAPFEEDDTDEALPEGDTLDAPFEEGDTLDAPFDEEDSGEVPQDDSTTESAQPEAPAHVLDAFVVEEAPVHAGQREGQQPISTNEDAEVAQAPTTTQVPATESQGDSLLGKSTDEAIEPAESRHQHASAVHLEPEPTSPTVEPEVKVPSANASPVAHRQPSAPPTPVRKPVTAPLQQTPVTSSRPSSQSPAVAARSPYASTVSIARTLIFSEVSRSAAPRPPLVDYDSDSEDDLGANDTVEGITEAWDVTAADVRFDADATRAIRFEDAEIDDSRLDWNITAIAPVLGAAAAAWTSPRVTSPSLPALASPSRSLASRSPQTRPRTSNPIVPPSPAQSSRAPSVLPAGSPALCAREPSFLAPQSPARGTRVRSPLVAQSPARALSQPRVHSPALRSSVASSSVDLDEEAHRTLRHDAPPPSDGILPTSSPAKPVSVHPDEGVDEDEAEESADATVIANGHRDGEYAQEASRQVYGRHIAQHDDEADEEHPDGAEDNTNDHLDHGDGDDEMGDEDEGLDDESDNENEVEARDAPDEDDGRIVLALVSRGIVKVEPNEERDAPVKETRGALPVVESPAQQPPALQFPARIGIPSPFVLAAARSRASSSSQAAGPSQLAHEPSPAAGPSNGPLPSNTSSLANGSPVEDASSEPGPSNRRPPARAEVPAPAPPAPAPPPPPPAATSWRASRPRIPSALAQEISTRSATPSAQPSPVRSLHDELETAAAEHESVAESDESDSVSEPFNSVVDITSRDPYAAARAAAILKVNYEYVEHGILPDGTPGPITRPLQRTAEEIAEDIANRSMPDGTLDMASLVYDAELDLSYRADWSRSPSCFSSRAPDSPLPIPGGWGNRSSTKRKREGGHQSTARKKRHHDALLFTRKDWSTLNTVYRSERRKWIQECDGGARHEWDESRVVDAFIEKQQLAESDLVGRWSRDLLADYTTALGRRLTGNDKAGPRQPEASGADEEPEASRAELVPPSTIKRVIDWVWGVGTGRKRGSGGVVKRVQTPYVGNAAHAASPSDNPYDHDDSHATINYSRSRRSVSVQIPDGAGGLQLRTLDETFDIGDVTMAQTPSRPATRGLRPLEVASRAPAILEEEESESADEAEEAEESVRGDGDSAHGDHDFAPEEEDQRPKRPRRKYWQPASREYRYGAGDADNSRPLFAPVYPSLPDRSAAYTSVVSGTPRPLVKVRSGPADAIPFPLGGPSRSALPSNSTPNVLNIVRGFEASRQLDLSYESRRREKEKATVSGLRRVSSRVESLEESFERSGEGSSFERSVERSRE